MLFNALVIVAVPTHFRHITIVDIVVGLYRTIPQGRILDANEALVNLCGFKDREALLAVPITDFFVSQSKHGEELAILNEKRYVALWTEIDPLKVSPGCYQRGRTEADHNLGGIRRCAP